MQDYEDLRENMVQRQLIDRGVHDPAVLAAMRRVPRHAFVPDNTRALAYDDGALPIECGQTISQPYIVALMLQSAMLRPSDRVLEIGTGSGYAAAVMARIVQVVHTVERHERLALKAREQLQRLGCDNVIVHVDDGTLGLPSRAPFDAIVAAASGPYVPPAWREQLAIGGRLIMPVGPSSGPQHLIRLWREADTDYREQSLGMVAFVPLIGEQAWHSEGDNDHAPNP
ncbi:protein-L-isoaspartate(D-aspartate) O-methyltransferase [Achromobacter sp. AGC39]